MLEVCQESFEASAKFCVYIHMRPDGSPFYIGKGLRRRAHDFAPSRRTEWHKNIVAKYGRENIGIKVIPCMDEHQAFFLERLHIKLARRKGASLVNLTDGGEGTAGHKANEKQLAALAKGRLKGKKGRPGPRPELDAWRLSPAGQAHQKKMGAIGAAALHRLRCVSCCECGSMFQTTSAKAKACSRACEQRYRRAGKNKP